METASPAVVSIPRSLFGFSIFYGGMVCIAGVLGNKQVALGPLAVWALPPAPSMQADRVFAIQTVLFDNIRIWFAGIIAYGISQTLNVTIFSWLKGREGQALLWFRAGLASALSQIVDTLLFVTIAFYGVFPIGQLLVGQMIAKVVLSAVLVPPAIYLFVALGRRLDARA